MGQLVALLVLILVALGLALVIGVPSTEQLREDVDNLGLWAPVVFAALYAVLTLAPLPLSVLTVAAGLLLGFGTGLVVVLVGAWSGAFLAFTLARGLGREAVERLAGTRITRLDDLLERRGLRAVLIGRLSMVVPFTLMNYSAGLSSVRTRDYVIGTVVGIVPGTAAYVAVGAFGTSLLNPVSITVVAVVALVTLAVVLIRRRRRLPA